MLTNKIVAKMKTIELNQNRFFKLIKIVIPLIVILIVSGLRYLPEANTKFGDDLGLYDIPVNENTNAQFVNVSYKKMGTMKASWYGPRFHGRKTANGEIYDQMALTAAHKSLPFGTRLKLINPVNHKSIIVRVNDRGPYIPGRQIDLSKRAAMELGTFNKGVVKLKVEKIILNGINNSILN